PQSPSSSSITHRRNAPLFNQSHGGQTNLVHSAALSTQPPAGAESSLLPPTSPTRKTSRTSTFTLLSKQRPPTGNSSWKRLTPGQFGQPKSWLLESLPIAFPPYPTPQPPLRLTTLSS